MREAHKAADAALAERHKVLVDLGVAEIRAQDSDSVRASAAARADDIVAAARERAAALIDQAKRDAAAERAKADEEITRRREEWRQAWKAARALFSTTELQRSHRKPPPRTRAVSTAAAPTAVHPAVAESQDSGARSEAFGGRAGIDVGEQSANAG